MKQISTIIVGGGISGLACARTLADEKKNFLLITKEVGGRMLTSKSLTVDYGASYVTSEYKNVLKFLDKGERLCIKDIYFIQKETIAPVLSLRNIRYLPKMLKLLYLLNDFTRRLAKMRKKTQFISQKEALREDKKLEQYTKMSAMDFVRKHKLGYLHETFFNPVLESTAFANDKQSNAFYYLGVLIPLVRKTYTADFRHVIPRITEGFKHKIVHDEVVSLKKNKKKQYVVKTKKKTYLAKNVVIAVPYTYAHKFYPVHKTGPVIHINVLHIVGKREEVYQKKKVIFFNQKHHDITILWRQHTGSDIIFSKTANPNLEKYYEYHQVVKKIHWKNALMLSGSINKWMEQKLDKHLYLASDYNLVGLEDSFITGVYAANQILGKR